jgi:hypothetical protein
LQRGAGSDAGYGISSTARSSRAVIRIRRLMLQIHPFGAPVKEVSGVYDQNAG